MSTSPSLLSPDWHRMADLRPRLKPGLRLTRHWTRGQRWHVLLEESTGRSARLNPSAYALAARLEGVLTLSQLWDALEAMTPPDRDPPSQDDLILTVRQLHQHHLVVFDDEDADFGALGHLSPTRGPAEELTNHRSLRKSPWWSRLWAWRIPLIDPSRWLVHCTALARTVFSPAGLAIWLLAMLLMLATLVLQGPRLWAEVTLWMGSPRLLWMAALVYPVMKAIHETSHALAVHRWGGRVREAGITLMMLLPVPYVDASAASAFPLARHRVAVSAAGVMAELSLGALGLALWCVSDEGWLHDVGLVMWFIGAVSTVLFNANPLQRLDGYHVLTDACQLPNLAMRSRQWWQMRWQDWLGSGSHGREPMRLAPGERPWLMAYAPLAWLYMLGLGWLLSLSLGGISAALGMALALVWAATWLVWPVGRWMLQGWRAVLASSAGAQGSSRGLVRLWGLALLVLVLTGVPWPDATVVRGVVWPPEQALVRTATDGFIEAVHVKDDDMVAAGQLLLTLRNAQLQADLGQRLAQLAQAEQNQFMSMDGDPERAGQASAEITRLQTDIDRLQARVDALTVRAGRAGRLVLPQWQDLPGRYVKQGDLLGHVLTSERGNIRMAVRETDAPEVGLAPADGDQPSTVRRVSVRLASWSHGDAMAGQLWRDAQGATGQLPTAALSDTMGGDILTVPDDPEHLETVRPVVLMDVSLAASEQTPPLRLGERAWVRIDRGWSPPVVQLVRWMRGRLDEAFHPSR